MNESSAELWRKRRKRVEYLARFLGPGELSHMTDEDVAKAHRRIVLEQAEREEQDAE